MMSWGPVGLCVCFVLKTRFQVGCGGAFNPSTLGQRQENLYEFEARLVYIVRLCLKKEWEAGFHCNQAEMELTL